MNHLTYSVESALRSQNWETALSLALALPDIAGRVEYPDLGSGRRYSLWFDQYVGHRYSHEIGADKTLHVFLSGDDCYALRCAYLHEGSSDITQQRARKALDSFLFSKPFPGANIHCNQSGNKLQLQVDIFCNDIIDGVHQWLSDISGTAKESLVQNFLKIDDIGSF